MGASVSADTNDQLIDYLIKNKLIKTPLISSVFRAVDRGSYFNPNHKKQAYTDRPGRTDDQHLLQLSAPRVYSSVMESLKLRPGLSFLNLGSGSGYLSTMVGLVLGPYGINHGVELQSGIVRLANERLDDFLKNSPAIDEFDFCEPTFMVGNFLNLDTTCQPYDRVYCGVSCPVEYESYLKNLIKVGGILIMHKDEELWTFKRESERKWKAKKALSTMVAPLISPLLSIGIVKLGDISPPKLKHLCRSTIRAVLRSSINHKHPNLKLRQAEKDPWPKSNRRTTITMPSFNAVSDMSHDHRNCNCDEKCIEIECNSDGPEILLSRVPPQMSGLINFMQNYLDVEEATGSSNSSSDSDAPGTSNPLFLPNADQFGRSGTEPRNRISDTLAFYVHSNFIGQSSSSRNESIKPLDQSTHSSGQTRLLKRKQAKSVEKETEKTIFTRTQANLSNNSKAGTSSEAAGEPTNKMKRTAATGKKLVDKEKSESKENISEEENYSEFMVEMIGALKLPSALLRYLNYDRKIQ